MFFMNNIFLNPILPFLPAASCDRIFHDIWLLLRNGPWNNLQLELQTRKGKERNGQTRTRNTAE